MYSSSSSNNPHPSRITDIHPERVQLSDRVAFIGTILVISVLSDTIELTSQSEPYILTALNVGLRSICISFGLNTTAACLTQFSLQAIFKVTIDSIWIQIISIFITMFSFALRFAVGWPILVFAVVEINPNLYDFKDDYKLLFFLSYALPLYTVILVVYPLECLHMYRLVLRAKRKARTLRSLSSVETHFRKWCLRYCR